MQLPTLRVLHCLSTDLTMPYPFPRHCTTHTALHYTSLHIQHCTALYCITLHHHYVLHYANLHYISFYRHDDGLHRQIYHAAELPARMRSIITQHHTTLHHTTPHITTPHNTTKHTFHYSGEVRIT